MLVVSLLFVGALLGSFWIEWRHTRLDIGPAPRELEGTPSSLPVVGAPDRIQVEVLNGAGDAGAALRVTGELRAMGFDVVSFGNADHFDYRRTLVLSRSERAGEARKVADSLGVDRVTAEPLEYPYLDVTVILGSDWDGLLAARDSAFRAPERGLLDRLPF